MDVISSAYWICLIVGVLYTLIAFMMGGIGHGGHIGGHIGGHFHGGFSHHYGVGGHGHGHASGNSSFDSSQVIFTPFSPLVIAFFLVCFGGTGLILHSLLHGVALVIGCATASAFLFAWLFIRFFNNVLGAMQCSSEVRLFSLIGTEAEVTVSIQPSGIGEIAYVAMGSRCVAPARTDELKEISRHAAVRITRIVGNIFYVRPAVEEQMRDLEKKPVSTTTTTDD